MVKNLSASAGDARDIGSIPGSGRSPGGRYGKPLQYSCLENLTDRGAWWATVLGAAKSQIRLSDCTRARAHTHTHTHTLSKTGFNLILRPRTCSNGRKPKRPLPFGPDELLQ